MSLFGGKTTVNRADKISDFTVATAEYGSAVPEILGTTRTSGNVIYYDDFTAHEHKETQRAGKGGGSKNVTITYTYTAAIIFALCEGPIKGMGKVWIDKEIHTYPSDKIGMTLFYGTDSQEPWPYVVGKHPEKALPYTGLAYMAGVIDLGNNASLPNFNFEVKGKLTETGDGVDVNPADYILYILNKIGMRDINIAGIENYRAYCKAADLLISTPSDDTQARTAREIVNEIATLTNAYIFWSNDQFKIVPLADRPVGNWEPNKAIMYDLTPDDFLEQAGGACVTYQRKDSSEIYNRFTVEFLNRANGYEKESVSYEDTEDIQLYGLRQASTTKAHYVYTKKRAVYLAQELARKNKYERNKYTFKLDWAFCRLEVGDLVTLTDPSIGLEKQVALIDSVQEDKNGILTYTAVSRAGEDFGEAIYSVHDTERPYIDFSPEPGDVDTPAIFQPPTELTSNGNELWIGAKGKSPNWGGCNVWISDNNENYILAGKITSSARLGTLAAAITKDADTLEVAINGTLLSGSALDAERANTLCWIDGECLSYTTAAMLQNGNYELSGLVRGQYNTQAAAHSQGSKLARCDETLLKTPLKKEDVGKKLWLKFTSYNIFGSQEQSLADVDAYEYTVTAYYIPPVLNLSAHNRYRELQDGVSRYDIVVDWEAPDFANYLEGNIWYKTSSGQGDALTFEEGIAGDRQGYNGPWIFGGSGKNQVVIPQAIVGDTYLLACTTKDQYGESNSPDLAPQTELLVALKTTTPNTPDGFGITFGESAVASWGEVTNADVAFYEIRYNQNPGSEDSMLLVRTNGTSVILPLNKREGTLYLYAKSAIGKYSAPASLKYKKEEPPKPAKPIVTPKIGGMAIRVEKPPAGCNGVNYYINDNTAFSVNNTLTYSCDPGIYIVKAAYSDIFGEGPASDSVICTIEAKIDGSLIKQETLTVKHLTQEAQNSINNASVDKINIAVAGILGSGSALVMDGGSYALVTSNGQKLTGLFADENGVLRLQGDYLHITGDTVIDGNVITHNMLKAGCIDATNLKAENFILKGEMAISGGSVRLDENGLKIEDEDGGHILYDSTGMHYYDADGDQYAQVRRMVIGVAQHGRHVTFNKPWPKAPVVLCSPTDTQITQGDYPQASLKLVCKAKNITEAGFDVECFTTLMKASGSGSGSTQALNKGSTTTFTLSMPSSTTSASIPVTITAQAKSGKGNFKYHYKSNDGTWQVGDGVTSGDVYPTAAVKAVLKVNGSEKASWTSTRIYTKKGQTSLSESHTFDVTFSAGAKITIEFTLDVTYQHNMASNSWYYYTYYNGGPVPTGTAAVNYSYSTSTETVISTGSAMFLALDENSNTYTTT